MKLFNRPPTGKQRKSTNNATESKAHDRVSTETSCNAEITNSDKAVINNDQQSKSSNHNSDDCNHNSQITLKFTNHFFKKLLTIFCLTVIFILACFNLSYLSETLVRFLVIIKPFLIGGALAFVIKIPMAKIENLFSKLFPKMSTGVNRGLSLLLSLLLAGTIFFGVITLVIPILVQSIISLQKQIPAFLDQVMNFLEHNKYLSQFTPDLKHALASLSWDKIFSQLAEFLKNGYGQVFTSVVNTAGSIFNGVFNGIIAAMFMIYLLLSKEKLANQSRQLIYATFCERIADRILYVFYLLDSNFQGFIKGQIIDASILGLMTFACMFVLGIPYALMVSVLITITDLVPIIGPLIGVFASTLLILIENPVKALIFFIIVLILQQIEANIIYPRVVGNEVGLPAMWTLVAISVGGSLMGIVGMWLFVPLFAVAYAITGDYSHRRITEAKIELKQKTAQHILPKVRKRDLKPTNNKHKK